MKISTALALSPGPDPRDPRQRRSGEDAIRLTSKSPDDVSLHQ